MTIRHVLDLGCGTGQSFDVLSAGVGQSGLVVGFDQSTGMLKKARKRIARLELKNVRIEQGSAYEFTREHVRKHLGSREGFDCILCFLFLCTLKARPKVFDNAWGLLNSGGKMVIAETYSENLGFYGKSVNLTARADIRRRGWTELESRADDFKFERLEAAKVTGGDFIIASGTKS